MNGGEEFSPNPRKLIFYLTRKSDGTAPPPDEIVEELNFYKLSPEELSERHAMSIKEGNFYFFTRVHRKHRDSTSPVANRTVRDVGVWKYKSKSSYITYKNQKIGSKLLLRFNLVGVGPNAHLIPTHWVMEEYKTIRQSQAGAAILYDWVLCKVYKDGEAVANPNNQANQVQTSVVGVPQGDMVMQHFREIGTTSEVGETAVVRQDPSTIGNDWHLGLDDLDLGFCLTP